jgi:transposase-like protein
MRWRIKKKASTSFLKNNQKTFAKWGLGQPRWQCPPCTKRFLLFFEKEVFPYLQSPRLPNTAQTLYQVA